MINLNFKDSAEPCQKNILLKLPTQVGVLNLEKSIL